MRRIAIIGAGPAGCACAMTLSAAKSMSASQFADLEIEVFDAGHSDLLAAELWEVPALSLGANGGEVLLKIKQQVNEMGIVIQEKKITAVKGSHPEFRLHTETGLERVVDYVVIATGFKQFDLDLEAKHELKSHPYSQKARFWLQLESQKGIYVAGVLSGKFSMYSVAIGSGTEVACQLLSEIAGAPIVVHDVPGSR